jgi:hypothetical protein
MLQDGGQTRSIVNAGGEDHIAGVDVGADRGHADRLEGRPQLPHVYLLAAPDVDAAQQSHVFHDPTV